LSYFTLRPVEPAERTDTARRAFTALGDAGIPLTLVSLGPRSVSFIVAEERAREAACLLEELELTYDRDADCELVSIVALDMWEVPGFLHDIARALYDRHIPVLQMADAVGSVSCLVRERDALASVRALHDAFDLAA
jgi:aspartokinase